MIEFMLLLSWVIGGGFAVLYFRSRIRFATYRAMLLLWLDDIYFLFGDTATPTGAVLSHIRKLILEQDHLTLQELDQYLRAQIKEIRKEVNSGDEAASR